MSAVIKANGEQVAGMIASSAGFHDPETCHTENPFKLVSAFISSVRSRLHENNEVKAPAYEEGGKGWGCVR